MKTIAILLLSLLSLAAQGKLTGSVSIEGSYTSFDENSSIWSKSAYTDSVTNSNGDLDPSVYDYDKYSSSYNIPGHKERLSLSLFYFKPTYKIAFYSRVTNSAWVQPTELRYIDRASLSASFGRQKIILGDHYLNSNENFINYRKIRGVVGEFNLLSEESSQKLSAQVFTGITEYAYSKGDPVPFRYQSFYQVNRFERSITGGEIKSSWFDDLLELNVSYLTGKDAAEGQIDTLSVTPFNNTVLGGNARFNMLKKQVYLYGHYYQSQKDSVFQTETHSGESRESYLAGIGIDNEQLTLDFAKYTIQPNYFTFGQPYLITNRDGIKGQVRLKFSDKLNISAKVDLYDTNIDKDPSITGLASKRISLKAGLPISKKFDIVGSFTRFSDLSNGSGSTSISVFRLSNTYSFKLNRKLKSGKVSLFAGYNSTDDKSNYGTVINSLGDEEAVTGINSTRLFYGFSGFYNLAHLFNVNASFRMTNLAQEGIDKTNIISFQANARYKLIPSKLNLNFITQLTFSDNELENGSYFSGLEENVQSRYRLISAINQFNHNFVELGGEYLFNYSFRASLGMRFEQKDYHYLGDLYQSNQDLISEMLKLNNPNFFNQRESYNSILYTVKLSYLL